MDAEEMYDYSDQAETDRTRSIAEVLGLHFPDSAESGSEKNLVGVKSDTLLFSHRSDSRTYFIQDQQYGVLDPAGVYQGSESEQIAFARSILQSLDIPLDEVDRTDVLKEQMGGAEFDAAGKLVRLDPVREGANYIWFTRQVEGLPVWDSRLLLSLTKAKTIGFMELHWPEIPTVVLLEGHRLAAKVSANWQPPRFGDNRPDKIEAGIIHSPALGFFMDIYPDPLTICGGKNVQVSSARFHFDRDGNHLSSPRQVELPPREPDEAQPKRGEPGY